MRQAREQIEKTKAKAQSIWDGMDDNERHGVRFGLFPAGKMRAAESEGFDGHELSCALMAVATENGGMRA